MIVSEAVNKAAEKSRATFREQNPPLPSAEQKEPSESERPVECIVQLQLGTKLPAVGKIRANPFVKFT